MTTAKKIASARASLLMTQAELAAAVGVTKRSIAAWEAGTSQPAGRNLRKRADALAVTPDYLTVDDATDPGYTAPPPPADFDGIDPTAALELQYLTERTRAVFASDTIADEVKLRFLDGIMQAYLGRKK